MPSALANPQMHPIGQLSLRQSAKLPPPSCPPLPPPCAGGEGEWEEIQIGPPPAAEGVAS